MEYHQLNVAAAGLESGARLSLVDLRRRSASPSWRPIPVPRCSVIWGRCSPAAQASEASSSLFEVGVLTMPAEGQPVKISRHTAVARPSWKSPRGLNAAPQP